MSVETTTTWAKRKGKRTVDPILLASRIDKTWLGGAIDTVSVHFGGQLRAALVDLVDAAGQGRQRKNLPIGALRLMLQGAIDGVIAVDKNLGCSSEGPAVTMYRGIDGERAIVEVICERLRRWHMDTLDPWAEGEGLGDMSAHILKTIVPEHVSMVPNWQPLIESNGRPNFPLIARQIADRLVGETLFPGMGPCQLVLPQYANSNGIELMTAPRRGLQGSSTFSMVARVSVATVPYSSDLYLTLNATKRVWAEKLPDGGNTGKNATAYVFSPGRPVIPVAVARNKADSGYTWGFDAEYAALYNEAQDNLPENLLAAVSGIAYTPDTWWAGLPQLTRLYRRVAARTVLESDEFDLLETAKPLLLGIITDDVFFQPVPLVLNRQPAAAMLRLEDFGVAGTALADDEGGGDDQENDDDEGITPEAEREAVGVFRDQCRLALDRIHGGKRPKLWIVGGSEQEQRYMAKVADILFGDAIDVSCDPLPAQVHGLRSVLPSSELKSRPRFDLRVGAWNSSGLPTAIATYDGPRFVLICAAKEIGRLTEDPVNRRAAIHAMCSIAGASVHHVLPIEPATPARADKATKSFIHRAQSAMMDVVLAHSGFIIGADDFVKSQMAERRPKAIYGVQALRKNAQAYSGENPLSLVMYSRLNLSTNVTEVSFGYKEANRTQRSPWMQLANGLIWLGSHRQMQGDEDWLKREFQTLTIQVLQEISQDDPRAIVLLDWPTLPSLWKELSDDNLSRAEHLRLGHVDLGAALPLMSFVRVRHGPLASMALRTWSQQVFDGLGEMGAPTGEFATDTYVTTNKKLIELNPGVAGARRGHFVGVMGYRKTLQFKRGLSCYRTMLRKERLGHGLYRDILKQPADFDAGLPAAIDLTVMQCPEDVAPAELATLAMGLRLGYAHYNEWTVLPAPLFFGRKIDDYIIKYPAGEDEGDIEAAAAGDDGPEVPGEEEAPAANVLQMVVDLVKREAGQAEAAAESTLPEKVDTAIADNVAGGAMITRVTGVDATEVANVANIPKDATADRSGTPEIQGISGVPAVVADEQELDLLARAKRINIDALVLYPQTDPKVRRIFVEMVTGKINIRVELPYFVELKGFYGPYSPSMRNYITKSWNFLLLNGYAHRTRKPLNHEGFLDFIASKLIHPQGAYICTPMILFGRPIIIPATHRALMRYNKTAAEPVVINNSPGRSSLDLSQITRKAIDEDDDDTLAWLIFTAAQTPGHGCARSIIGNVSAILGPMSEAALHYYIDCAEALGQAFANYDSIKNGSFQPIHKKRSFVPVAAKEDTDMPKIHRSVDVGDINKDDMAQTLGHLRNEIFDLVRGLEPGSASFAEEFAELQEFLGHMRALDELRQSEVRLAELADKLIATMRDTALALIAKIREIDEESSLGAVDYIEPGDAKREQAKDDLAAINGIVAKLEEMQLELIRFYDTPLPAKATLAERGVHSKQATRLHATREEQMGILRGALVASCCFRIDGGPGEDPNPNPPPPGPGAPKTDKPEAPEPTHPDNGDARDADVEAAAPESAGATMVTMPDSPSDVPAESPEVPIYGEPVLPLPDSAAPAPAALAELPTAAAALPPVPIAESRLDAMAETMVATMATATGKQKAADEFLMTPLVPGDASGNRDSQVRMAIDHLAGLVAHRHYTLAAVYVDALRDEFKDLASIDDHCTVLSALCDALESVDCNFTVDPRLDGNLRTLLQSRSIDQSPYATPMAQALGILAAGFVSVLFAVPGDNADGAGGADDARWTIIDYVRQRLTGLREVSGLIDHLATMDSKSIVLTRDKFHGSGVNDKIALQMEIERATARAAQFKRDPAIHHSWSHSSFTKMHEHLFSVRHPIGQCLQVIAKGDLKYLRQAYEAAHGSFKKPAVTLADAFKEIHDRTKPEGKFLQFGIKNISVAEQFILDCLALAEKRSGDAHSIGRNDREFLDGLHFHLTAALREIEAMCQSGGLAAIHAMAATIVFRTVLRLYDNLASDYCIPQVQQRLLVGLPMDRAFVPSMRPSPETGCPGLCLPIDVMTSIDDLASAALFNLQGPLSDANVEPLLIDALREHVQEMRFLPAFAIAGALPNPPKLEPPLQQQYLKARADLTRDLQDARQRVTHAMSLSALNQKDAATMLGIIENLSTANTGEFAIGHPKGTSSAYPDFPHAKVVLRDQVLQQLNSRLEEAREKLFNDLAEFEESHGEDAERDIERIRSMLTSNNPANLRTAHDAMTILRSGRKLPSYTLNPERTAPAEYESFLKGLESIRGNVTMLDLLHGQLVEGADCQVAAHLDAEGRANAAAFIARWKDLCIEGRQPKVAELAGEFFASLGIAAPEFMHGNPRARYTRLMFGERAFNGIAGPDCFVPPALGSPTGSVMVCIVHGNQVDNDIMALVQDVSGVPTFILARSRLNLSKRARIAGRTPVILIDDNLIAYMAVHPDERARRMMEVGTLTFYSQPYSADGTSVPKEMFFGRQRELDNLRRVQSLAVLYGGRRLGKSSLLAQIERDTNSMPGTTAIYIPMNRDYHGGDHVTFAWRTVARAMASRGIIEPLPQGEHDWSSIRSWIEQQLLAPTQKAMNIFLLLDESDDLMGRELDLKPDAIGLIGSFHQMVESLHSKVTIRYVIAGLHNLTRMTNERNSALGKAETIALEPFNTGDDILRGIELIMRPMAALGFFFAAGAQDLPLRILSLCNYYPAFIQAYCKKLLEHMYNKRPQDQAVAYITAADLDAVENDHDLLTELQTRFGWTLDLDKRYKAIALILADIYYHDVEIGKNDGVPVSEIRDYCEIAAAVHFRGMSASAYESLVDEMRKLNVLERNGSRYRLRNPSVAMLIGDRDRITHQLKVLAEEPPERTRNHGDRRLILQATSTTHVLFPMPVAWTASRMDVIDGGLVVIAGNNLSGVSDLCGSSQVWPLMQNSRFRAASMSPSAAMTAIDKLKRPTELPKDQKMFLASASQSWQPIDIAAFTSLATKAAAHRVRLGLLALPQRIYGLCQAIKERAIPMPTVKAQWEIVPAPAWSIDAVRFHLAENAEVADSTEACAAIIEASCGFGKRIEMICAGRLTRADALNAPAVARKEFAPDLETFYKAIGWPAIEPEVRGRMEDLLRYLNGEQRGGSYQEASMVDCGLANEDLLFLRLMGLLQEGDDNTWVVPKLYAELLDRAATT